MPIVRRNLFLLFIRWKNPRYSHPHHTLTDSRYELGQVKVQGQSQPKAQPRQGRAHKLLSFIVFLHILKASASNGSKNKKLHFLGGKLWSSM